MHILSTFILSILPLLTTAIPNPNYNTTCTPSTPDLTNCSPNQCPHQYTFSEFQPSTNSNRQPYFRFLILLQLNKNLCPEQAHKHWRTVHADLTMAATNTGVNIVRYVQFHADQEHKDAIQSLLDTGRVDVAPYDGIAEFHAKDGESLLRFISHAFADPVIAKDQSYFVDGGVKMQVMAGYDALIYGSAIETLGGTDGLVPSDPRFNNDAESN